MGPVNPSMRPKVKGDTFFLPDPKAGVYFRNNSVSFRMEGRTIDQWMEKLIPMFNGEHTLEDLTDGLPDPHRNRVYEIVNLLYQKGFIRDVSQDRPHQLPDAVLKKYASQIECLDHWKGSGAYRFQSYRQANVLAVGSGPFFVSLVAALLESGLPKVHLLVLDSVPTHRQRLAELAAHARRTDPEVALEEVTLKKSGSWRETVRPFDSVLYVSQEGDLEELRVLDAVCREERKVFIPAVCLCQAGLAGPVIHPDSEGRWESAWRRIHRTALCKDPELHTFSSTAGAILANGIVFEWFKTVTGVMEPKHHHRFFLLDLETLEGDWHTFIPHPLAAGSIRAEWVQDLDSLLKGSDQRESKELFPAFRLLTSVESGIFHRWEEGDLKQLPLAQCRVQVADPLSEGPAELLPDQICTGLTHEEARREAGLAGLETYASRLAEPLLQGLVEQQEWFGVGAGQTSAEGICRGLQKCLDGELCRRQTDPTVSVFRVPFHHVEDERCRFYLRSLTAIQGEPVIALGKEVFGFPVVWVGTGGRWYGHAGLNQIMALRQALQQALSKVQNPDADLPAQALENGKVLLEEKDSPTLTIPVSQEVRHTEVLRSAIQVLKHHRKRLWVVDLALEQFLKKKLGGVFGVLLREEESW
ncbi:putative thiazole-containing bacteriocin maturation protein [Paludifilum halophilum]|uniref:Putative thiazole-containing bacteriocin maturation protein n=1 Tax=Paludifilum halophilum TaxID=1642702 RepID=A0A235B4J1_9BACL|nr:putative thiazole-containing bacteriocin maturation protein [Paludifilum halophilum]OYD06879.1 putative thiazole-containing bacteriocin maturation protein [Paludifilum halophilum]